MMLVVGLLLSWMWVFSDCSVFRLRFVNMGLSKLVICGCVFSVVLWIIGVGV